MPVSLDLVEVFSQGRYLQIYESDYTMMVENIEIVSDLEDGDKLIVTGDSLEGILKRRIVWEQTQLTGNLQSGVQKLLNDAIINPTISNRRVSNFIFQASTDPGVTSLTIDSQYTGDNLYEVISTLCIENGLGYRIQLNTNNQFVFSLYKGADRSYSQSQNPAVVFSPEYENVLNSNYYNYRSTLKTVTLVAGEGEGKARTTSIVDLGGSGVNRYELFTDARDISSNSGEIPPATITKQLQARGRENLAENKVDVGFDGMFETTILFKYGEDFKMGDIVQIENGYGVQASARVVEFIRSIDLGSGASSYPQFEII